MTLFGLVTPTVTTTSHVLIPFPRTDVAVTAFLITKLLILVTSMLRRVALAVMVRH